MPSRLLTTIRISLSPSTQKRLSPSVAIGCAVYEGPGDLRGGTTKIPSVGGALQNTFLLYLQMMVAEPCRTLFFFFNLPLLLEQVRASSFLLAPLFFCGFLPCLQPCRQQFPGHAIGSLLAHSSIAHFIKKTVTTPQLFDHCPRPANPYLYIPCPFLPSFATTLPYLLHFGHAF